MLELQTRSVNNDMHYEIKETKLNWNKNESMEMKSKLRLWNWKQRERGLLPNFRKNVEIESTNAFLLGHERDQHLERTQFTLIEIERVNAERWNQRHEWEVRIFPWANTNKHEPDYPSSQHTNKEKEKK